MSSLDKIEKFLESKREEQIELSRLNEEDRVLAVELSRAHSLETKPGGPDNWIEAVKGELPDYISRLALELIKKGAPKDKAIAQAISTVRRWAAGGEGVKPDTVAKAQKAIAEWQALKAKAHAVGSKTKGASKGGFPFKKK